MSKSKTTFKNIEIERLRAIAVIMIVTTHGLSSQLLPSFMRSGFTGVDIFFAISGYVITKSFLRSTKSLPKTTNTIKRIKLSGSLLKTFYLKRVIRIFPSAIFWIIVYLFLSGRYNYAVSYGLSGNISHYWTLSAQLQFYLLVPLLLLIFPNRSSKIVTIALINLVLIFLLPLISSFLGGVKILKLIFANRYFSMFMGVLLALVPLPKLKHKNISKPFKIIVSLILIFLIWSIPGLTSEKFTYNQGFVFSALFSTILVYLASLQQQWILDIKIVSKIAKYIGSRSYGIYLSHLAFIRAKNTLILVYKQSLPVWLYENYIGILLQDLLVWISILVSCEIVFKIIKKPISILGNKYPSTIKLNLYKGKL